MSEQDESIEAIQARWQRQHHDAIDRRDFERSKRLVEFVKGEVRNMTVNARLQFTVDVWTYLQPEVTELIRQARIENPV